MQTFNDPYLDLLHVMSFLTPAQLEILREYAHKLKTAYAEKEREDNGTKTTSGKA